MCIIGRQKEAVIMSRPPPGRGPCSG